MKKNTKKLTAALMALLLASQAQAGTLLCPGTIVELGIHQPGQVYLSVSGMPHGVLICSMDINWTVPGSLAGTTTPAACKSLYAGLLAAKLAGAPLKAVYFDADGLPASCSTIPAWTQVNLRYFAV